jgi:aminopeptidase N
MKICILLLIFFLLTDSEIRAQQSGAFFSEKEALQEGNRFFLKSNFKENNDYNLYDLIYQRMEWSINPGVRYIKGKVTSCFVSQTDSLSKIDFNLHDSLTVDSVIHRAQQIDFTQNANILSIQFNQSLNNQEIDSISVYYEGEPGNSGYGSFVQSEHDGVPIIWTLSEPYGALDWWPCKQSLADKIDSIDILVTTPEAYRTASNGVLICDSVSHGKRTMHWKHRFPIATYLVAIAATNYVTYSDFLILPDKRKIEILNYVFPENLEDAKEKTPVTADIMQLYNDIIGEYPFASEKYGHAQFGWGGGMEHQTMSFMGNFNFELVAHELAHQWFGDFITPASWQDIWLNEGFATYLTGLTYENLLDGVWWPQWKKVNTELITNSPSGSVFVDDTTNVSSIFSSRLSYSKGAYLLHMLRWILGDTNFFDGLRSYFNDPTVANGFATTQQFVQHMENAGDTTLNEFFTDWFFGEGFPLYSASYSQENSELFHIRLSQTTSDPSVEFFEMPVPVRVYNFDKTDSSDFRLINTINNQEFTVNPGFQVAELKIDPDKWLVSKTAEILKTPHIKISEEFRVFPNPFENRLNVLLPTGYKNSNTSIFITEGKLLKTFSSDQTLFDVSKLRKGMYIIRVETMESTFAKVVIKQ